MNVAAWFFVLFILEGWRYVDAGETTVDCISPRKGSLNGETRVTISGRNFARTHFNFGAGFGHLGNKIELVSSRSSYECRFHPDGTHEEQITCYTPKLPEDEYTVRVAVDGVDVPEEDHCASDSSCCVFKPSWSHTPTIENIEPFSGPPGTMVTISGKLVSDRYGSNIPESTNGRTEKMLRVYLGGSNCELKDLESDTLFGITLDNGGSSQNGKMICKHEDTYVSSVNGSFIVEGGYGRSLPSKEILRVSSKGKLYMFQTYTYIEAITPSTGSKGGKTRITITGKHFDETDEPVRVRIGDTDCHVVEDVTDTQIVCETEPDPEVTKTRYLGNRGLVFEIWNETSGELSSISGLSTGASDYSLSRVDNAHYTESEMDGYLDRMSGFFIPPKTSAYVFYIMGDDQAELYLSSDDDPSKATKICETNNKDSYFKDASQRSNKVNLTEDHSYYMKILHKEQSSRSFVKVAARAYSTGLVNSMTGQAVNEKQKIEFTSTVLKEELTITLSTPSSKSATQEVQTVVVDGNTDISFRLGMFGVFSEPLLATTTESDMTAALNKLPVLGSDTVSVSSSPQGGGTSFVITFQTDRGDLPDLESRMVNENATGLTVTVTETTKGASSLDSFSFKMADIPSPSISVTATADNVKEALLSMFSSRCPSDFGDPSDTKYFEDFEGSVWSKYGSVRSNSEPFCGRASSLNPSYLYNKGGSDHLGISLSQYGTICFAYRGEVTRIYVRFSYEDSEGEKQNSGVNINMEDSADSEGWTYGCYDMNEAARQNRPSGSDHRVDRVDIVRASRSRDVYVDVVAIVRRPTTSDIAGVNIRRLPPARPNNTFIKDVEVNSDEEGVYSVKLTPYDCGFNFPLLGVAYAKMSSGDTTSDSTQAVFAVGNEGSNLQIEVTSDVKASPPIGGFFLVTYKGRTTEEIPPTATADELKDQLQSLKSLGNMHVTRSGICSGFYYEVEWLDEGGDKEELEIETSLLTGSTPDATVTTLDDGSLFYDPIPGDMLRTHHGNPQVQLSINGIPSECRTDCSFDWTDDATPTVDSIRPTSGEDVTATITGTGFDTDKTNVRVSIAGSPCNVTDSTETTITCDVGTGPAGSHKVKVDVLGKGEATGDVNFAFIAQIDGISPMTGSTAGGTTLTITGRGFNPNGTTSIGNNACLETSISPLQIICLTPPADSTAGGAASVVISQPGGDVTSSDQFTYSAGITPVIDSLSVTSSDVKGGDSITISGTSFGASAGVSEPLTLGGVVMNVTSYSDISIVATLPSHRPGPYPLQLRVSEDVGYAELRTNSIPNIEYTLKVTNIYPTSGSLFGGTKVTITGEGFVDDTELTKITFGPHGCVPETISSTKIVCSIERTGRNIKVDNSGSHTYYGKGYAWKPSSVEIKVGDVVTWSWTTPKFVPNIGYRIEETISASSIEAKVDGFSSGATKTRNGLYQYTFWKAGEFPYWSGYVDDSELSMKGKVTVTEMTSHTQVLKLEIAGQEAEYFPGGSDPSPDATCPGTVEPADGCSEAEPEVIDNALFNFKFLNCSSPVVTSLSHREGTSADQIEITGTGFSATSCHNKVTAGDAKGTVGESSSETSFTVTIDPLTSPVIAVPQEWSIRVDNRGYAAIALLGDLARRFVLLPVVESVDPTSGSAAGGSSLTISGAGFQGTADDVTVRIDGYECEIENLNYTQVTCSTPQGIAGEFPIVLTVRSGGTDVPATCNSNFTYSDDLTPTVTSVSPDVVSLAETTININGTSFGTTSSDVMVTIGGATCIITDLTDTSIECDVGDVPVGSHKLDVRVAAMGRALTTERIESLPNITSIDPNLGSTFGEVDVVIEGNGFVPNSTSVTVDGETCSILSVHPRNITCTVPANSAGVVDVVVTSSSTTYEAGSFEYSSTATPTVASVSPTNGVGGDTVEITGTLFSDVDEENTVTVGGVPCIVTDATTVLITCTLGDKESGNHAIKVVVRGKGASDDNVVVTYSMDATGISPSMGGIAGGQTVTISGTGFAVNATNATICDEFCLPVYGAAQSATEFICITPEKLSVVSQQQCDVVVTVNDIEDTLSQAYTYKESITASVSGVTPSRGGTGGGTLVTISGDGFGSNTADVTVTIGGSNCNVSDVTPSAIECYTGESKSQKTKVVVEVGGNGKAKQDSADFEYIDVWSSRYTWGGMDPPTAGDLVVVPRGQILLLDVDTPVLKMLLIQGGSLIFDEVDVELQAENILITDGGKLQVGTEEQPFQHKAIITMHGNFRSPELPIYGTKTLAVREGILDLHGRITPVTWTRLAQTADKTDTIVLQHPVNWQEGDEIVIATTGARHSQSENEVRRITNIAADNVTLTLDSALTHTHIGITRSFSNGFDVDFRAEVGLLTHNVVVRGARDVQWDDQIEACPDGFNTGEFATQTCFLGRFGAEMGSDEFGSSIMIHAPRENEDLAIARISFVEVTHAGQAFRLGRYPIHFHLNGDMSSSYVKGCSIHRAFNRAVNVHGTHNTNVEFNVLYDVKGGAFFLEDGIETGNAFRYNLGVFVRASTSLLNDDITPATFWVTNPNNTISHNAAAGGSHFGFWYRMHTHPEGPSFTTSVCCKHVPLGEFKNNTAHSFGWFGLWIFEDYFPKVDGSCSSSADALAAKFESLTAWNCEKGAEAVNSGSLQFIDFVLVNNEKAGYEGKQLFQVPQYDEANGPLVKGGLIAGYHDDLRPSGTCTKGGIVLPYQNGFLIKDVTFENFDREGCAAFEFTRITGTCSDQCGGFLYKTGGLAFHNANHKVFFAWDYEGVIEDMDGTLTGGAGQSVIPTTPTLPPAKCSIAADFSVGINGSVCDNTVRFHRFAFNGVNPKSLEGKNISLTNQHGTSIGEYRIKRISHKPGWMTILVDGEDYVMEFVNAEHLTNISFTGVFYQFESNQYITMSQQAERPDRFIVGGTIVNETESGFNPATAKTGSWIYENSRVKYVVSGNKRSKRGVVSYDSDRSFAMQSFRCYYRKCITPPKPDTVISRPETASNWSRNSTWEFRDYIKPVNGENVTIPVEYWIIADEELPRFDTLIIEGGLEIENDPNAVFDIHANFIIIFGRLVIGWNHTPFLGVANIFLYGSHESPIFPVIDGPTLGSKVIAVYGGLDLHGRDPGVTWTSLGSTAVKGSRTITLAEPVTWEVDSEIVLSSTTYNAWATETFKITEVADDNVTLTLNESLVYTHSVASEQFANGWNYSVSGKVGLLTRNIKIIGGDYDDLYDQSFGARVIVARTAKASESYSGFAQIENVEFYHTGQEGYTESYDPRFSIAFVDVTNKADRGSYVKKNAFHNGFSRAIGAFGIADFVIEDNIVHHTVGPGIVTNSDGSNVIRNLVMLSLWPGSYQDRREPFNIEFEGGIEAIDATNLVLRDNVVAGSERLGYHLPGEDCADSSAWSGNEAHANLQGLGVFPVDTVASGTCVKFSNFVVWKSIDFGYYLQNTPSFEVENVISIENKVGLFTLVIGPSIVGHQTSNKYVHAKNSLFVGKTSSYDCSDDVVDGTDDNIDLSAQSRAWSTGDHGKVGISWPNFCAGGNNAPEKPWAGIMAYNAISGIMRVTDVTFANFETTCSGSSDFAITTNPRNDDLQHPIESENLQFYNVDNSTKIFIHEPNVGKINPSDCVDMDCDALKKAFLKDLDGSVLGTPGTVLPFSEYEWNGDSRRGLGDYRVPKIMQTAQDGTRLELDTVAPNKGIFRDPNCTFHESWRAYECHEHDYEMLAIENMDKDTETRRLSPVAILGQGYLDLINGPQDHGWCSGYTCRKRVSTFHAIVASNVSFDIYFTSTSPQVSRYHLLNARPDQAVRLGVFFARPNRLDIFVVKPNNVKDPVMPKNGEMKDGKFYLKTDMTPTQYLPDPTVDPIGSNYLSREEKMIFFIVTGEFPVEIQTASVIIVSYTLPAMTIDEFFGENLVSNLAAFLNIDPSKVRIVDVVNEQSVRRKKRSVSTTTVNVEIGDEPGDSTMSYSDVQGLETVISNGVALGTMDNILPNGTVPLSIGMTPAVTPADDPDWTEASEDEQSYTLSKAGNMAPHETPVPGREGMVFDTPIRLRIYNEDSEPLDLAGSTSDPWQVTATLTFGAGSHGNATLLGTTTIQFSLGWANFTDLAISMPGEDYTIVFAISSPAEAGNFTASVSSLTVLPKRVTAEMVSTTTDPLVDELMTVTLELKDEDTGSAVSDIAWRGHTWEAFAIVSSDIEMGGTHNLTFNPATSRVDFVDLTLPEIGRYYLTFSVLSTPSEYNFTIETYVDVTTSTLRDLVVEKSSTCQFKFDVAFDPVQSPKDASLFANLWAIKNKNYGVRVTGSSATEGSVIITITFEGNAENVTTMISDLCSHVTDSDERYIIGGQNVSMAKYMMVDGVSYYGSGCGAPKPTPYLLHPGALAAIIILCVVIIVLVVGFLIWKFTIKPKSKTSTCTNSHMKYLGHVNTPWQAEDFLFRDDSYLTVKSAKLPVAPANTYSPTRPNARIPAPAYPGETYSTHSVSPLARHDMYDDRPTSTGSWANKMPLPAE